MRLVGTRAWSRAAICMAALWVLCASVSAQNAGEEASTDRVTAEWLVVGDDLGVWLARNEGEKFGLLLAQRDESTAGLRRVTVLGEMPQLLVGTPSGPLLFFEARGRGDERIYPVRLGSYEDRAGLAIVGSLEASTPLRTTDELVAGVAADDTVFLLLDSADPNRGAVLLAKDGRDWQPVRLPVELADASRDIADLRLLRLDGGLSILVDGLVRGESVLWTLRSLEFGDGDEATSEWESVTLGVDLRDRKAFAVGLGDEAIVLREAEGSVEGLVLRRQGAIRFALLEGEPAPEEVATHDREIWLLRHGADDAVLATVLSRDGTVLASGELAVGALRGGEDGLLFLLLVAWSVVISAMVLVLPQNRKLRIIVPPDGFVLAEPARRMLASVIDLLPGVILVSLVWQKPVEWWLSPLSEIVSADGSMPIFTLAWATFGYLAIADGVWGRTLGKLLVGCRTVTDDGGSPGLRRGAARSFLKVFCPPLVVVLLLMPYAPAPWSFGTVVVRKSTDDRSGSDQDA